MSISKAVADELLVKCGRRCCICRRFDPLHLTIHHIIEKAENGDDTPDNLIPVCVTCHTDVHAQTKLTRRFTTEELKGHRESLFTAIADGRIQEDGAGEADISPLIENILSSMGAGIVTSGCTPASLSPGAMEMLLNLVNGDGIIHDMSENVTFSTNVDDVRRMSKHKASLDELEDNELVAYVTGILYRVTDSGFLLADEVMASQSGDTE